MNRHSGLVEKLLKSLDIIASHVGTPKTMLKASPPSAPTLPNASPPTAFLVYGVSQHLSDIILAQRIWSVPQVTFEAFPYECNVIPSIILCLAGFICPDETTVANSVTTAWLQSSPKEQMVDILLTYDPNFSGEGARLWAQNAIQSMAISACSEPLDFRAPGGGPAPRWNIYVTSPTSHIFTWSKIQLLVYQMTYPSILSGTGSTHKLFSCTICHSFNHPRGLCSFPGIQGWNGPQHLEHPNDFPMRGRGRGRERGQYGPL